MAEGETPPSSSAAAAAPVLAALASLQTYSSALSAFTSAWRALYSDATALDSTLASRLEGFSELDLLCSAMDGPGLRAYLTEHRDALQDSSLPALDAALLVAPDPGRLVLSAAAGFCRAPPTEGAAKVACRLLVDLLDRLRALGVKPSPEARDEARAIAADWKRSKRIGPQAVLKKETIAFLLLVGAFGLVDDVGGASEVLDLVVSVSGRERAVEAFVGLGLDLEKHMPGMSVCVNINMKTLFPPVFIHTMIKKGKQLEAVKFIQALNLVEKYPLLPVLRSYISDAAKAGNMIRIRGDDSACQTEADAKERMLLGVLQKFIKDQKLEELPILEIVKQRLAHLEKKSVERKRAASAAIEAAHEVSKKIQKQEKQQQQVQSAIPSRVPGKAAQNSLSQNIHSVDSLSRPLMSSQSMGISGVLNLYQAASSQNIIPAISPSPLSQHPVGIKNQTLNTPPVQTRYGGLADYYGLSSGRPRPDSVSPGSSVTSAHTSSRSKLYSADPLAAVSRASDKKGSSYNYSLSSMSTYIPNP
uniref:FRIGIDA-like protein n=1 Tax=Oryza nivara TaxID=4536 RepID=A0A0E0GHX6_ORYNI